MAGFVSKSEVETGELAEKLWRENEKFLGKKAVIFALEGEMGAGKTAFTKGLAKEMRIKDEVISPTFVLEAEYDGGKLIHIDAWRMEIESEIVGIDFEKRLAKKQVIVIEWAEKVRGAIEKLAKNAVIIWVKFEYGQDKNEREIKILNFK